MTMVWILFTVGLTLLYTLLIGFYRTQFNRKIPESGYYPKNRPPFVSVVIVGRNEAGNIRPCLESIFANDYPAGLFEVLYVDDHSEDESIRVLESWKGKGLVLIQLADHLDSQSPVRFKKQAISVALSRAQGDLILHTDADTVVAKSWIRQHSRSYQQGFHFTAAPVLFFPGKGFLAYFQKLDFLVTMAVTAAGIRSGLHFLANGANMSYDLAERRRIKGEAGLHHASGDDVFLVQAFGLGAETKVEPKAEAEGKVEAVAEEEDRRVNFLMDAQSIVYTYPEKTWTAFFNQRFRWAGKSRAYRDKGLLAAETLVFGMNATLLINFLLLFAFFPVWSWVFAGQLFLKMAVDVSLIRSAARHWQEALHTAYLFLALLFYPVYYLIVGISVLLPVKKRWKGRVI
jgi:glycosyltransferase involved in cell wall biosynthesis